MDGWMNIEVGGGGMWCRECEEMDLNSCLLEAFVHATLRRYGGFLWQFQ